MGGHRGQLTQGRHRPLRARKRSISGVGTGRTRRSRRATRRRNSLPPCLRPTRPLTGDLRRVGDATPHKTSLGLTQPIFPLWIVSGTRQCTRATTVPMMPPSSRSLESVILHGRRPRHPPVCQAPPPALRRRTAAARGPSPGMLESSSTISTPPVTSRTAGVLVSTHARAGAAKCRNAWRSFTPPTSSPTLATANKVDRAAGSSRRSMRRGQTTPAHTRMTATLGFSDVEFLPLFPQAWRLRLLLSL